MFFARTGRWLTGAAWLLVVACQGNAPEASAESRPGSSDTLIYVKDLQQYGSAFVAELKQSGFAKRYALEDSLLIFNGTDTAYFPNDLPMGKQVELTAQRNDSTWILHLLRKNYVTVAYRFQLLKQEPLLMLSGEAELGPLFFLGAETDTDDRTGDGYLSVEYRAASDSCQVIIRIGTTDPGDLLGKLVILCPARGLNMKLDDAPTLSSLERKP